MKKYLVLIASLFFFVPFAAFARTNHHRPNPSPTPVPPPVPTSSLPFGVFTGDTKVISGESYQALFLGDQDDFTQSAQSFTLPLVVYYESNLTAVQLASGAEDKVFAKWNTEMSKYGKPIILAWNDEMNLPENSYSGNPTAFKQAWIRARNLITAPNVGFYYDPNVAYSGNPVSNFLLYFPGNAYVDGVALDGFGAGSQTFASVFNSSLQAMRTDFPTKPLWILSTGTTGNASAWIQGLKSSGAAGLVWFSYQEYAVPNSTLLTL